MIPQAHQHKRFGHILFAIGAFLLLIGGLLLTPLSNGVTTAFGVSEIVTLTNQSRSRLGKTDLRANSRLMNSAQMKAEDMVRHHYFAHTAPDGTIAWDYFKKSGYNYSTAGENLAITNEDAQAVITGWLNSPTHRSNLLSSDYRDLGIGMAYFGDYQGHSNTYVIVALYGTSTSSQSVIAPTNPAGTTTSLKPRYINTPPNVIVSLACLFIISGILLELRHIRHLHNHHAIA